MISPGTAVLAHRGWKILRITEDWWVHLFATLAWHNYSGEYWDAVRDPSIEILPPQIFHLRASLDGAFSPGIKDGRILLYANLHNFWWDPQTYEFLGGISPPVQRIHPTFVPVRTL